MPLTNAEKQANYKARLRKKGFDLVAYWVHKDDKESVRQYIEQLKKARTKEDE